jgi:integrase
MRTKKRFWLCKRGEIYFTHDTTTGERRSLNTRDAREAEQLINAKNVAVEQPGINLALAQVHLAGMDRSLAKRTWEDVIDEFCRRGKPETQAHRRRQLGSRYFAGLRQKKVVETTAGDFLMLLNYGRSFIHANLRCLHNLALGLGWLPWPVLQSRVWPKIKPKAKRGITLEEHERIIACEKNRERRLFYEILWEVGAAQSDGANLFAENVDWQNHLLRYRRMKTGEWACLVIGTRLAELLGTLPKSGPLFPKIQKLTNNARSAEFCRRCRIAKVEGVSLHSYRYSWAERAKACGYPERFAQSALGHNSRAVHQAYARGATPVCPALDQFEQQMRERIVPMPMPGQAAPPAVAVVG